MPPIISRTHLRNTARETYGEDAWARSATLGPILPEGIEITCRAIPTGPDLEPMLQCIRDQGGCAAADLYDFTYGAQPCEFSALLFLGMWNAMQQCGLTELNVLASDSQHNSIDGSLNTWVDVARGGCYVPEYCSLNEGDVYLSQYVRLFDLVLSAVCVVLSGVTPLVPGLRRRSTFVASRDFLTSVDLFAGPAEPFVYTTVIADTQVVLGLGNLELERLVLRSMPRAASYAQVLPLGYTGPDGARPGRPVYMVYDRGRWDMFFSGARINALLDSSLFVSMAQWELYSVGGLKLNEIDQGLALAAYGSGPGVARRHTDFAVNAARLAWVGRERGSSSVSRQATPLVPFMPTNIPSIDSLDGIIGQVLDELAVAEREQARLRRRAALIRKHSPQTAIMNAK